MSHTIGETDLFRPPPAPYLKIFQEFVIYFPKYRTCNTIQSRVPNISVRLHSIKSKQTQSASICVVYMNLNRNSVLISCNVVAVLQYVRSSVSHMVEPTVLFQKTLDLIGIAWVVPVVFT